MLLQTERSTIKSREGFPSSLSQLIFLKEKFQIPILLLVRQASPTLKEGNSNLVFEVSTFVCSFYNQQLIQACVRKGDEHPPTPRKETVLPILKFLSYMASTSMCLSRDLFERGDFLCLMPNSFFLKKNTIDPSSGILLNLLGEEANGTLGLSTLGITNFDYEDTFYMFKLYHLEVIPN